MKQVSQLGALDSFVRQVLAYFKSATLCCQHLFINTTCIHTHLALAVVPLRRSLARKQVEGELGVQNVKVYTCGENHTNMTADDGALGSHMRYTRGKKNGIKCPMS